MPRLCRLSRCHLAEPAPCPLRHCRVTLVNDNGPALRSICGRAAALRSCAASAVRIPDEVRTRSSEIAKLIAIVYYGVGNLHSVAKAFTRHGFPAVLTSDPKEIAAAAGVVLPGDSAGAYPFEACGRSSALRSWLQAEQDRGPDLLRLANALSALYPKGCEEKRLLDVMLAAVPR